MPKRAKYLLNPAPFVMGVVNPMKKKKKKHHRKNPAAKRKARGLYVLRKPTRNPRPKKRRAKKRHAKRNAFQMKHVLIENSAPKRSHKKRRKSSRKISTSKRNPMSKKRRSKKSHRRNPARRSHRRKSSRRMRNPMGVVSEVFNPNMLIVAGSAIGTNVLLNMVMNRLIVGDATGKRPFNLPGVDYTVPPAQFYQKNGYVLAAYKLLIGAGGGWLLRNQSARISQGMILGSTITAGSDIFKTAGLINQQGMLGTVPGLSRNYPARAGMGYLPGTNMIYTNPAQQFLATNNVPRPRGMGAMVGPNFVGNTEAQVEGSFRGAN